MTVVSGWRWVLGIGVLGTVVASPLTQIGGLMLSLGFPITLRVGMQRSWKYGGWTLAGVLAAGALFDALANALQLVTPLTTYIGTITLVLGAITAHLLMKHRGMSWQYESGIAVRLKGLGPSQLSFVLGIILLLWYPRAKDLFDMMAERKVPPTQGPSVQFKKLE